MISRRTLASWLALGTLLAPLTSEAQQAVKVPRIGYLSLPPLVDPPPAERQAFLEGLRERGYVEGKNIVIEYRRAEGRSERLPDLAAELVLLEVDVIVATAQPAIIAAKNATRTIPIVALGAIDPVETGLIASLARPGGNITGLTFTVGPEIAGKRLELLKEVVPRVSRIAVLLNPTIPGYAALLSETKVAARSLRVKLQALEVRSPDEFEAAFAAMTGAGALIVISDPMFMVHRARLADLAARRRLPAIWTRREYVEAGGLMAYGVNLQDVWRRGATFVDRILKGAKPADLPVEQPTKFELVVNARSAKALGLTIPPSILIRADHVIQ